MTNQNGLEDPLLLSVGTFTLYSTSNINWTTTHELAMFRKDNPNLQNPDLRGTFKTPQQAMNAAPSYVKYGHGLTEIRSNDQVILRTVKYVKTVPDGVEITIAWIRPKDPNKAIAVIAQYINPVEI